MNMRIDMWIDRIPATARRALIFLFDLFSVCLSLYLAFFLRFDGDIPPAEEKLMLTLLLIQAPLRMTFLVWQGLYRGVWRYASVEDLMTIFRAMSLSSITIVAAVLFMLGFVDIPRSVFIIDWALAIILVGGVRFVARVLRANPLQYKNSKRVLVIGADDAGESLLRSILFRPKEYNVVGLVSDNPHKQKMRIHGVPVLGTRFELAGLVKKHRIHEIFIAMPTASAAVYRDIVSQCQSVNVRIRRIPAVRDILNGHVTINHLREVQLEDLLGREPVTLDNENVVSFLRGKIVLVTGAGGSIGSELCRQIVHFRPRLLLMLDQAESGLYHLDSGMRQNKIEVARELVISDIVDAIRVKEIFSKYRPTIIFHAAAHKHLPLMEMNKKEAVKNNVFGTRVLAEVAHDFSAEKFVMISTDKAVNPTSVMGASKRLAEMFLQGMAQRSNTAFITVRFGNVLGSDGSVLPLFRKQLMDGGPLTVTHPDIERYFMTIPEAVQLVLQAATIGKGGEIFILDMGQPIKIADLARNLITLTGYKPEEIGIRFTGLRPGEKLFEELWSHEEKAQPTIYNKILVAQTAQLHSVNGEVDDLQQLVNNGTDEQVVDYLRRLVPNYNPSMGTNSDELSLANEAEKK
jgi:FlaA1/EpsC-like NDP-sugar epimerase